MLTWPVHTPVQPVRMVCHAPASTAPVTGSAVPAIALLQLSVIVAGSDELLKTSICASWDGDVNVKPAELMWKPAKPAALLSNSLETGTPADGYTYHCPICQ